MIFKINLNLEKNRIFFIYVSEIILSQINILFSPYYKSIKQLEYQMQSKKLI